jgi:hypothetical protein
VSTNQHDKPKAYTCTVFIADADPDARTHAIAYAQPKPGTFACAFTELIAITIAAANDSPYLFAC